MRGGRGAQADRCRSCVSTLAEEVQHCGELPVGATSPLWALPRSFLPHTSLGIHLPVTGILRLLKKPRSHSFLLGLVLWGPRT